ncbi:uncharacterized protein LOC133504727 isoform X3 [Syngnathoides biaculeatus]|uniref:uncharacterized protein LOC133504727 isoform X3 n=1 Tax=Syngnathoides biaculeatus TaxID=300417 RepID=UPI002ADD54C0|nr:uncharacterized protein LOC133504727 isoform X3 [Syngnathoides biaculeatus]XP_061683259.1 uncharacterized protein LOC133504727 isoform X3 [Syngnathoides biaculeatus]
MSQTWQPQLPVERVYLLRSLSFRPLHDSYLFSQQTSTSERLRIAAHRVRWQEIKRTRCSAAHSKYLSDNSGSLPKSLLVMAMLAVVVTCGKGAGKPTECCKKVSSKEITEEVLAFKVEIPQLPCLPAVIFYTKDGYYCAQIRAPWVLEKTAAIRRAAVARALTTSSPSHSSSVLAPASSS